MGAGQSRGVADGSKTSVAGATAETGHDGPEVPRRTRQGGRAEGSGELGEVVGRVAAVDRVLPPAAVDEVVPVWDDVAQRAALVADGHGAVHAGYSFVS